MSKVTVDASLCVGCGLCEQGCPEVFEMGDDGIAHTKAQACDQHNLSEVAEQCPIQAIIIE